MPGENETKENVIPFRPKTFSRISDDPRVEVLQVSKLTKGIESYSFRASTIDHLESVGADKSAIFLQSGTSIILSLPYAALTEKLDDSSALINLKDYYEPQPGDKMQDGSIFVGISPDSNKRMYAAAEDLPVTMKFNEAAKNVRTLDVHGHQDWGIPSKEELLVMFKKKDKGALAGTFKTAASEGSDFPVWYWSSTEGRINPDGVYGVRFSDGGGDWIHKDNGRLSCRTVRFES